MPINTEFINTPLGFSQVPYGDEHSFNGDAINPFGHIFKKAACSLLNRKLFPEVELFGRTSVVSGPGQGWAGQAGAPVKPSTGDSGTVLAAE